MKRELVLDKHNDKNEIDFKKVVKYGRPFDSVITYCEAYNIAGIYEFIKEECKNPQRECKNCSVYHGFKGSGRLYEQKTK